MCSKIPLSQTEPETNISWISSYRVAYKVNEKLKCIMWLKKYSLVFLKDYSIKVEFFQRMPEQKYLELEIYFLK